MVILLLTSLLLLLLLLLSSLLTLLSLTLLPLLLLCPWCFLCSFSLSHSCFPFLLSLSSISTLSHIHLHLGAAVLAEGLSCALQWVRWTQLKASVSGTGQPWSLLTEATPEAPSSATKILILTPNISRFSEFIRY